MAPYAYRVNRIRMKCGTEIEPKRITVFVGPNNGGKTRTLRDIYYELTGLESGNVTVESINIEDPESWEEMNATYHLKIDKSGAKQRLRSISPTLSDSLTHLEVNDVSETLNQWLKVNKREFYNAVGRCLVLFLNTDTRLSLAKRRDVKNLDANGAKSVLEALFNADSKANKAVRDCIKEVFGTDIRLDISNLGQIQFRADKDLSSISTDPQEAKRQYEARKVPVLDTQGDGLRSFAGIVSALISTDRPIVLLDEPEAFLHPPQAYQMGRRLSGLIKPGKQVFIATHSADFLRGLLSSETEDATIVRITHIGAEGEAKVLNPDMLHKIVRDPMLSSSRVLEGMFYQGVIATEADSDSAFYQRSFARRDTKGEIHFVSVYGKQALKKLIDPYRELGIRYAVISDADVIRDEKEFAKLVEMSTDQTVRDKITAERDSLYRFFQTKSKYQLLSDMRQKIVELGQADIPEEGSDEGVLDKTIEDYRATLNHIRDDSDELKEFKKHGRNALPAESRSLFDNLFNDCAKIGLFIVPVGEMEAWLEDYDIPASNHKSAWILRALEKLDQIEYDNSKELWKFIDMIYGVLTKV